MEVRRDAFRPGPGGLTRTDVFIGRLEGVPIGRPVRSGGDIVRPLGAVPIAGSRM